ncbi:MAG: UbiA family prenyltransferase [Candidatus Hodarchaeales archaeon]|jgi:geranylgeranylglycerol-phosphate geranylgeranyltransferase
MKVRAVSDLARMKASIIVGMTVILGTVAVLTDIPTLNLILFGFGVGFVLSASTNTINDIMDLDLDRIEKPNRPLPRKDISVNQAWGFFAAETIIAYICGFMLSLQAFFLTFIVSIISILYSIKLKNYFMFKNTLTAFGIASAFLVGAIATQQDMPSSVVLFFFLIFITVVAFEIHKDIADIEGDSQLGKKTIPTVIGLKFSAYLAVFLYLIGFLFFQGILISSKSTLIQILWVIDIIGIIGGFFILLPLIKNQDPIKIHQTRKRAMFLFAILVIAVIINFITQSS